MHVGMVGINHKLADLSTRELLAKACQRRFGPGASTHGEHHFILLSTCNRTELYFHSSDLTATHAYVLMILRYEVQEEFEQKLYSFFGQDCFLHLVRVTSGLDSAIVAETEIQGQVKAAYELSSSYQTIPFPLHFLFQKALHVGKEVRTRFLRDNRGRRPSLEEAVWNASIKLFGGQALHELRVLCVGASEINQKMLLFMKRKGVQRLTICNRTQGTAEEFAAVHQGEALSWERLSEWVNFDVVIFGTKSPELLLQREKVGKIHKPVLIIDLGVPRNVDFSMSEANHVTLLNIDHLNDSLLLRHMQANQTLVDAEVFIREASQRYTHSFSKKGSWQPVLELITA